MTEPLARGQVNIQTFLSNIKVSETGCWLWQRRLTNGYGHIRTGSRRTIRGERRAHLVAYELYVGPIPEGLQLDHTCHTEAVLAGTCAGGDDCVHRRCVNPAHLEPVTPAENTRRSGENCVANVNRGKTHCVHGHEFTPENTRTRRGKRECRQCGREQDAARKRAARAPQADHDGEPSPSRCGSTRRRSRPSPRQATGPVAATAKRATRAGDDNRRAYVTRPPMGAIAREAAQREARVVRRERTLAPGRVVIAVVRAFNEDRYDGKNRPVVLVSEREDRDGGAAWAVMGLTSLSTYRDGGARASIADWRGAGLNGPGYFWGGRLAIIPLHDMIEPVGWITYPDALTIRGFITDRREGAAFITAVAERKPS